MMDYLIRDMGNGVRCRWVVDELHETRGSYCYETEEETRKAEDNEIRNLETGEWVVLGCIVERKAVGCECPSCNGWHEGDALWGIVIESRADALDEFARHSMDLEA